VGLQNWAEFIGIPAEIDGEAWKNARFAPNEAKGDFMHLL